MRKHARIIGLVIAAILSISYFVFWRQARAERAGIVNLCQGSVYQSLERFKEYAEPVIRINWHLSDSSPIGLNAGKAVSAGAAGRLSV